jgi:hypothetical protein
MRFQRDQDTRALVEQAGQSKSSIEEVKEGTNNNKL